MVAAVTRMRRWQSCRDCWRDCWPAARRPTPFHCPVPAHHGRAISRGQDYLGSAVNLAARVAAKSGGGQFLATRPVADAAQRSGIDGTALGRNRLRNIAEPVYLFEVRGSAEVSADTLDPVCRMSVDPAHAAGWLAHAGQRYWFCSLRGAGTFAADPGRHIPDAVGEPA